MIKIPERVFVATSFIDLRMSFDRLAGVVRSALGDDPRGDALFVFHNQRRTMVKMLWHDTRGYCIFAKRLDRGTYRIPLAIPVGATRVTVSHRELALLLEGIDAKLLRDARRAASAR